MKAIFEIIPRSNNWHKFWIFVAGCATGAAGAIGAILIKERTEVRDGCVIFRGKDKSDADFPQSGGHSASSGSATEATQGRRTGESATKDSPKGNSEKLDV